MPEPPIWVCPGCGANFPPSDSPPPRCALCEDERQWVRPDGQRWATMPGLADDGYRTEVRDVEPDLLGVGVNRSIGVGQRGLLVCTAVGNVLWDPPGYIDEAAIAAVRRAGGLAAVTASHPHMYGAMVEWSRALGAEIVLPEADDGWLMRPEAPGRRWAGTSALLPGVTLVQCGGHFAGSAVLHWAAGAEGRGVLLSGDTLFVTPGEDRLSFVYSAPNRLPLSERAVQGIVDALAPYEFDRVYGGWWTPVLRRDAQAVLDRSARRYIELLRGD
jgi:glyoxylase-like metal-dependent hydrolase (beta-lactamase superfamily II)